MAAETSEFANTIKSFMSARLDVDSPWRSMKQPDNIILHGRFERGHFRPFKNQCYINIPDFVTVPSHNLISMLHKLGRVTPSPPGISILENLAYIGQSERAKDCIND